MYIWGSVIFAILSLYYAVEGFYLRRIDQARVTPHAIVERLLYFFGSIVFWIGCMLQDRRQYTWLDNVLPTPGELSWGDIGGILFGVGSFMFAAGAFVNALELHKTHMAFVRQALMITSFFQVGGLCFVAGTAGFYPGFHCNQQSFVAACWCFLIGSVFYTVASLLSLMKAVAINQLNREEEAATEREHEMQAQMVARQVSKKDDACAKLEEVFRRRSTVKREERAESQAEMRKSVRFAVPEAVAQAQFQEQAKAEEARDEQDRAEVVSEVEKILAQVFPSNRDSIHAMPPARRRSSAFVVPRRSALELPQVSDTTSQLASVCSCGNIFMPDAEFCRRCGTERPGYQGPHTVSPRSRRSHFSSRGPGLDDEPGFLQMFSNAVRRRTVHHVSRGTEREVHLMEFDSVPSQVGLSAQGG